MKPQILNKKIIIGISLLALFALFYFFFFFRSTEAQVCLPLDGYLVWPGTWESGWIPMASTTQYVLKRSPIYVSGSNVGIGTLSPVYNFQVNGTIYGQTICLGNPPECRTSWPTGGGSGDISGSGYQGQVAFWTSSSTISGSNNLFWSSSTNRLGIGTTTPQAELHVVGNIIANNLLAKINASYVSSGQFGYFTGGGNYSFPENLGINVTTTDINAKLHIKNVDVNVKDFLVESTAMINSIRAIGGTNGDIASSIQQTSDGGYIVAGNTLSFGAGNQDFLIIKLNSSGNIQWSRAIGGIDSDQAQSIQQTSDGGYIVAGLIYFLIPGNYDVLIIKLDSSGNIQWSRAIGGTNYDSAVSIQQTSDGGYIVAGRTRSFGAGNYDALIIKLDSSGNIQWSRAIGGTNEDDAVSIQQTSDGGYIVAGYTNSFGAGNSDALIIKLNSSGNIQWSRAIGGTNDDRAFSIQQTSDGGYIVAGGTWSFGAGNYDVLIIKLDSSGNIQWSRAIGGTNRDLASSIQQTSDGGYIVAGGTWSFGAGNYDVLIIKLDSSGNIQWSRAIGGTNDDYANSIQQTSDGGYIVAGWTYSFGAGGDVLIIKLDSSGNISGCGNVLNVSPTNTSISPTNTSVSPTNNSISPTNNSISPINNSVSPTVSNVCYGSHLSLSPIFEISSGKINIGYNILNPKAFLNIGGSVQIGHGGTPIRKIQHGIIGTCSSDGSAGSSGVVNFPYAFSSIPLIFFMPSEEFNNSGCNTVRINSRSTTGFSWSSWSGTTQTACDCIYWMAIEP
jgi:uncharacterized delta-60 repeat protein